ncbi:hypothetical protein [Streptomyces triticiradicis]|uniref:Uncharacterized protein n=1 Tax=Streptomyces triticiradicis TaxID=2651189 RepID=A0A7J5D675_9ACTN|nr:hypothetical protein [Streptomyces triticiradicis]KAB1980202.1 hypothetical protein F8144_34180 [Streptomyces triticiradicis]
MGLLSWLTRSDKGSRGATEPTARAGVDAGTTPAGPDAVTGVPATAGWRSTPPVQRTLGAPMGLVTDPGGFGGRLGTWQDPTVTGPLGHLVSAQAPSGVAHGLAQPTPPVQRTGVRPQAPAFGAPRAVQDPVSAWAGESGAASAVAPGAGDRQGDHGGSADRSGDPHGAGGPVVFRSVSPAGSTARDPGHAQSPAPASIPTPASIPASSPPGPAPLPLVPLQRVTVAPAGPVPPAPVMVMRVPSSPAAPAPARPLTVAEPPDVPARELAAVAPAEPDERPGPLAPDAPAEPVADLLATPGTATGQDGEDGVLQRTGATDTARLSMPGDTAPLPLPLAVPRTGTAADRGPDTATAPLVGGADGTGPVVRPAVQRDVTAPPRPRHRGLGEPLPALPPTALPLPGPAAPPAGSAASPSAPSGPYVSRTVEEPVVSRIPEVPQPLGVPQPPAVPDAVAGPAGPGAPSPGDEGTAPLLGDTPPLTTDRADLGTASPPGTVTGVGVDAVEAGSPAGPRPDLGPGPGPDDVFGPFTGTGGTAPSGPVALQRLDVTASPSRTAPSADVTPAPAEGGRAPLLGDAGPLAVSDPVVPEAPGPGEMVTASTPMPLRRLDAVDEAALPGPVAGTEGGAGTVARGSGPVFPLVAQRSLPLYTVPSPSAGAPVADGPPAVVPVRWEPAGGGASASGTGGSGGRARSADAAAGGSDDHGGPGGGHTATGGSTYSDAAPGGTGGVVQRSVGPGAGALAYGAPPARSRRDAVPGLSGRPGFPGPAEFPGVPDTGAPLPGGALQPSAPPQGWEVLGPAVPLQRLAPVPGAAPPLGHRPVPPTPPSPPLQGQEPSPSTPPGVSAGAAAVAAGVARWMPDGSVEFTAPAVQRTEEGVAATEPPADPPERPEPTGPAVAEPPPGTTAPAGTPGETGGAGAPKVTDELVRALVAPLSRLLRVELRIERERTGSLMNIRH